MKISTFETSKKFRLFGFILALGAAAYFAIFNELIGTLVLLVISIYCDFQYKCPHCQKTIDIREKPGKIQYCPLCGESLD